MIIYFWYILGATFTMSSSSDPYRNMITYLSVSMWIYSPGMSNVSTSQPSCVYTHSVMKTYSVETVGESESYFFIVFSCFLPSTRERPFMYPFQFSFRNINYSTASALGFLVSLVASTGAKVSRMCSCVSYFVNAASPYSLDLFSPFLVHIVSWWCVSCDCPFHHQSCLWSIGCVRCCEFYMLWWV